MRDPNRLDDIYMQLKDLHKEVVPDWRIGQLWVNFIRWHYNQYGGDPFFPEDYVILERFKRFLTGDK